MKRDKSEEEVQVTLGGPLPLVEAPAPAHTTAPATTAESQLVSSAQSALAAGVPAQTAPAPSAVDLVRSGANLQTVALRSGAQVKPAAGNRPVLNPGEVPRPVVGEIVAAPATSADSAFTVQRIGGGLVRPAIVPEADVTKSVLAQETGRGLVLDADAQRLSALASRAAVLEDAATAAEERAAQSAEEADKNFARRQQAVDRARAVLAATKVDPLRVLHSMSTGQKILSAIAVLLGGVGAGLSGSQRNMAYEVIRDSIDRDIEAQRAEVEKNAQLLQSVERDWGSLDNYLRNRWAMAVAAADSATNMRVGATEAQERQAAASAELGQYLLQQPTRTAQEAAALQQLRQLASPQYAPATQRVVMAPEYKARAQAALLERGMTPEQVVKLSDQQLAELYGATTYTRGNVSFSPSSSSSGAAGREQQQRENYLRYKAAVEAINSGNLTYGQYLIARNIAATSYANSVDTGPKSDEDIKRAERMVPAPKDLVSEARERASAAWRPLGAITAPTTTPEDVAKVDRLVQQYMQRMKGNTGQ